MCTYDRRFSRRASPTATYRLAPRATPRVRCPLRRVSSAVGLGSRYTASHRSVSGPSAPRSLSPLVAELDRLGIDRVFTNYSLAYRLDFDTNERIVAVENRFEKLVVRRDGDVIPTHEPVAT